MERRLAAILCADVCGYSRLMGEDEEATLHTLTSHRKLIDSQIENHHGRVGNSAFSVETYFQRLDAGRWWS
jgi:class 3 adenylate cyclase